MPTPFFVSITDITDPKKGNMTYSPRYRLSFAKVAPETTSFKVTAAA